MHVQGPICQGQLIEKKIRSITLIVWVLERVEKSAPPIKVEIYVKICFCFV